MRLLRVAPPAQTVLDLPLDVPLTSMVGMSERGWWQLPQTARTEVVVLLARLIARGVLVEDTPTAAPEPASSLPQPDGLRAGEGR